jgi:phenylpropionate dioxygenase-like ring-hydroxylating dioxygenase large terminal subunit
MEIATTLKSQIVQNRVREVGINPNHWYPVEWANQLRPNQVMRVQVWQCAIAVYRDAAGKLYALEDACPHRGIALSEGKVQGEHLACAYHGWEFSGQTGDCVHIPYLPADQKLPCAQARSYPVQEHYGLIWIFPGDPALAQQDSLPHIPEFSQPGWLMVPITGHFQAHFSICNENTMDVFHGFLHQDLQGWFDPVLIDLSTTDSSVTAKYNVSYKGQMAKFLGLAERADEVTTLPIRIHYQYPHYQSSLEGISSLYLMRLPVSPTESRSFAFFFFRVQLPQWILQPIAPILRPILQRFVLERFLAQDIGMIESEQQTYSQNPHRRYVEINPAIIAIQRLTVRQYEEFMQQSRQSSSQANGNRSEAVSNPGTL